MPLNGSANVTPPAELKSRGGNYTVALLPKQPFANVYLLRKAPCATFASAVWTHPNCGADPGDNYEQEMLTTWCFCGVEISLTLDVGRGSANDQGVQSVCSTTVSVEGLSHVSL